MAATQRLDELCINTIRTLSMDAVEKAQSGHPGTPMALAPLGYALWTKYLRYNPQNPCWPDRDRFVLSAGHASMFLYSLIHLAGYDLSLEELKNFRQWGSHTAGHPEKNHHLGVETTTGPLGQGLSTGVGMAIAERHLASRFNQPGHGIVDHYVYAIAGDGDIMEGVSSEAASLAGHLGLGKLIYFYDDNKITIEGKTDLAFSEDVAKRFEAYGWHTQRVEDGNDLEAIGRAVEAAQAEKDRPSLVLIRTHIAYGSPNKQDTSAAHGAPLGAEEVKLTKKALGWPEDAQFLIPEEALAHFRKGVETRKEAETRWQTKFDAYAQAFPELAKEWERVMKGELPAGWDQDIPKYTAADGKVATRVASGKVLNAVAPKLPELIGGSADLAPSNNTYLAKMGDFAKGAWQNRNLHFGIREHGMAAILSGMALHGGVRPFGGTFFVFADYLKPSLRLACLMKLPVHYVLTHDSIGLGEDGPTHQPIEHLASLRSIPGMVTIRPADAAETAVAWRLALEKKDGPVALILTRQNLPVLDRSVFPPAEELRKGAYVLAREKGKLEAILIATGSEVDVVVEAWKKLTEEGVTGVRVVNMPSWELFEAQDRAYRDEVLPPACRVRLAVEAASPMGWERYVGLDGGVVGMTTFGASAPAKVLMEKFGFTPANVISRLKELIKK